MAQMIRVIYTPEGGSKRTWEVDLENPAWDIHKAAPKAAGFRGWNPFVEALDAFDADAWQAMIWALRRRTERGLTFAAIEFPAGLRAEVDFAGQCPDCDEWFTNDTVDDHACAPSADEGDEDGSAPEA